jgi:hypothetical protein
MHLQRHRVDHGGRAVAPGEAIDPNHRRRDSCPGLRLRNPERTSPTELSSGTSAGRRWRRSWRASARQGATSPTGRRP